ncbi:hypothetical protein GQ43DRAFT_475635 [Delitschia confertaspora ATCC 74209]|uniref:Uncharacterized protein n=1 Tax=Delitschia confertaspora ATCC 74209 TaxID=1513339 RepID=A0A9P4JFY5_9PLEO|nr:hypothetical protein GQ43DRAFT_475635 [Delitschia confertaspora ATCC 74209]
MDDGDMADIDDVAHEGVGKHTLDRYPSLVQPLRSMDGLQLRTYIHGTFARLLTSSIPSCFGEADDEANLSSNDARTAGFSKPQDCFFMRAHHDPTSPTDVHEMLSRSFASRRASRQLPMRRFVDATCELFSDDSDFDSELTKTFQTSDSEPSTFLLPSSL